MNEITVKEIIKNQQRDSILTFKGRLNKKHFMPLDKNNELYNFKYNIGNENKQLLDIKFTFILKNKLLKIEYNFNTNKYNYAFHYAFLNYLFTKLKISKKCFNNIHKYILCENKNCFKLPIHLSDTKQLQWCNIVNILYNFILCFNKRCNICCSKNNKLFSPNNDFSYKYIMCELCIPIYNISFVNSNNIKKYIENNKITFNLIWLLMKSTFLSSRFKCIYDIPSFMKDFSDFSYSQINKFFKKHKTIDYLINYINISEYSFYLKYPYLYKTILYYISELSKYNINECNVGECYKKIKCQVLKITHKIENKKFNKYQNDYVYHGSIPENWTNIIKSGLQPGNINLGTLLNANVYGKGIYVSDSPSYSFNYSKSINYNTINKFILGVYQVSKPLESYKQSSSIFLVPQSNDLQLCYLFIIDVDENINTVFKMIHEQFTNQKLKQHELQIDLIHNKQFYNRLIKEYKILIKKIRNKELFIDIDKTIFNNWIVKINIENIIHNKKLYEQLQKQNIKVFTIEILFSEKYPFDVPITRLIKPKLITNTKSITSGGCFYNSILTKELWTPINTIEDILFCIKTILIKNEIKLDEKNIDKEYNKQQSLNSYKQIINII